MPYKDPEKAKANKRAYYEKRKAELKEYGKKWYEENKDKVLEQHAEKSEELKKYNKEWRKNNREHVNEYKKNSPIEKESHKKTAKNARQELKDWYVMSNIKARTGLTLEQIKEYPELIQSHREQIKLKRLIKQIKNGKKINTKTD